MVGQDRAVIGGKALGIAIGAERNGRNLRREAAR
jgi:hypothetical protein